MFFANLNRLRAFKKLVLYLFCVLAVLILQESLLCRFRIAGAKLLFVPCIVLAIGFFSGGTWGGMFGIFAGLACDFTSSDSVITYLLLYAAFGFAAGFLIERLLNRRLAAYAVLSLAALALTALVQIIPLWVYGGTAPAPLVSMALRQVLFSWPLCLPCYAVCRAAARSSEA